MHSSAAAAATSAFAFACSAALARMVCSRSAVVWSRAAARDSRLLRFPAASCSALQAESSDESSFTRSSNERIVSSCCRQARAVDARLSWELTKSVVFTLSVRCSSVFSASTFPIVACA